jgi:hypothetical protein
VSVARGALDARVPAHAPRRAPVLVHPGQSLTAHRPDRQTSATPRPRSSRPMAAARLPGPGRRWAEPARGRPRRARRHQQLVIVGVLVADRGHYPPASPQPRRARVRPPTGRPSRCPARRRAGQSLRHERPGSRWRCGQVRLTPPDRTAPRLAVGLCHGQWSLAWRLELMRSSGWVAMSSGPTSSSRIYLASGFSGLHSSDACGTAAHTGCSAFRQLMDTGVSRRSGIGPE